MNLFKQAKCGKARKILIHWLEQLKEQLEKVTLSPDLILNFLLYLNWFLYTKIKHCNRFSTFFLTAYNDKNYI